MGEIMDELQKLKEIPHVTVYNSNSKSGIVAISVDGVFAQDVAVYLNKHKICVRSGNHCTKMLKEEMDIDNTIRISLYFYNTKEEIDYLIDILKNKEEMLFF